MRLIDADMLIEMLRHDIDCYDTGKPDDTIYINAKDVINMITGQPAAYDVDRVVKQLEEKTEIAYNRYMDCSPNTPPSVYARYGTQYNERKSCLEIVKSGLKK